MTCELSMRIGRHCHTRPICCVIDLPTHRSRLAVPAVGTVQCRSAARPAHEHCRASANDAGPRRGCAGFCRVRRRSRRIGAGPRAESTGAPCTTNIAVRRDAAAKRRSTPGAMSSRCQSSVARTRARTQVDGVGKDRSSAWATRVSVA